MARLFAAAAAAVVAGAGLVALMAASAVIAVLGVQSGESAAPGPCPELVTAGRIKGVPAEYAAAYQRAGQRFGVPPHWLAAVGDVETGHGTHPTMRSYAGAVGPMQFLPSTWEGYATDGDGDGKRDVWDPDDAIAGAARMLAANGAPDKMRQALWAYNHSTVYYEDVASRADEYADSMTATEAQPAQPVEAVNTAGISDGGWGGHSNGQIPEAALASIGGGEHLRPDAARAWQALQDAARADLGRPIAVIDSYRSLTAQYELSAVKGDLAAEPGTSNHGWGLALDIVVPAGYDDPAYHWLAENGPRFGWVNPEWAREGGSKPEPWHWEWAPRGPVTPCS